MKREILIGTIMILLVPQLSWGQIPQTMSYQGVVTDVNGVAVSGGSLDFTFRLWDAATAGMQYWDETQPGVAVAINTGIFNVILGSVNPLNIPFDKQYWLGITIGTDPELTPRVQLTSSPYSLNSQTAVSAQMLFFQSGEMGPIVAYIGLGTLSTTESHNQFILLKAGAISSFNIKVSSNSLNDITTLTLRKNGVDTAIVVTIPASTTGNFSTAQTISFNAYDEISFEINSSSASSGLIGFITVSLLYSL